MKKTILLLLAAGVMAGCGTKNETTIEGTVTGLGDGTKVYLLDKDQEKVDSTALAGGAFHFEVQKAYPDMAYLQFDGERQPFMFIQEPGNIRIIANFGDEKSVVASGTDTNDRLKAMNEGMAAYTARMREISPKLSALQSEGKADTPEFDSLLTIYRETSTQQRDYTVQFLSDNPNTIFAAYMEYRNGHSFSTPEMVDSVLNSLSAAPANSFTDRLKERRDLLARTAVGQPAPDFTQNQPDGTPFTLSSLKGKLVLIDFWASWCGPCRAENPHVVKIYDRFKDKGFEIVGVSLDRTREDWLEGIEEDGLTWIHVSDVKFWDNAVAKEYAVRSIPHTVLVDPDGIIVAKNLRGDKLEEKIAEVLGE